MLYKKVEIKGKSHTETGENILKFATRDMLIQYLGLFILDWKNNIYQDPEVGFVEATDEDIEKELIFCGIDIHNN